MGIFHQHLIHHLGLTLLHFIWQGLLVGLVYGAILLLCRPASANARYHLALAALTALAALPALTLWWLVGRAETLATGLAGHVESLAHATTSSLAPGPTHDTMAWVVFAWLAGVILLSIRLALGWHHVLRLRRSANHAATAALASLVEATRQRLAIGRQVILAASNKVHAPLVVGYLRPLILFPPAMINRLSLEQIEMVLAHEMAHIRRHDHLVNLFQTVVETLLFYHPVVAWVSRQIRIERENACDDLAVEATGNRLAYVEMLASLERLRHPLPRLALSIQDGQMLGRIRRLVEQPRPARQRGLTLPAVAVLILVATATATSLFPETAPNEPVLPESFSASASSAVNARGADQDAAVEASQPTQDPLSWDFPDPSPATLDQASTPASTQAFVRSSAVPTPATARSTVTPQASTPDQSSRAIAPPAADDDPPANSSATAVLAPIQSAAMGQRETALEPDLMDGIELAALPARPRVDQEPPVVVETEPPAVTGGDLLHRVEPRFPARARQRQASGLVELEFTVNRNGQTTAIEILEETPSRYGFAQAARTAVAQWRFEPYRQGEQTLDRRVRMEIEFSPDDGCLEILGSRIPRC